MKRKNKDTTPETEESAKAIRREKAFSSFYAILLILTALLIMGYCTVKQFAVEREDAYASLRNSMYSLRSLITFEGGMEEAFSSLRDTETVMSPMRATSSQQKTQTRLPWTKARPAC